MFPDFHTRLMLVKAACISVEGVCIALVAGLAQWATGGDEPSRIAWIVIIASAVANGFGKLGNFLSTSFGDYMTDKKLTGTGSGKSVTETETKVVDETNGTVETTKESKSVEKVAIDETKKET